jgi:hypothetical protein
MTSYLTNKKLFSKLREVFVFDLVINKNLSQFLEIHLHLAEIRVTKTCLGQEIMKTEKLGLKDSFEYPNL